MSLEIRSSRAALFCKTCSVKAQIERHYRCFPVNRLCEDIFWVMSLKNPIQTCSANQVFLKISENVQENACARIVFFDKVAHHQASNVIKKRQNTVNFEKLIKALCRTPTVSASNFNSTFLTPRLRKTYIYVFPALLFFVISKALHVPHRVQEQIHLVLRYILSQKAIFDVLIHQFSAAQQTSTAKLPDFF